jgi:hypothetical protein
LVALAAQAEPALVVVDVPIALLFFKAPVPGRVKTRLARDIGPEAACAAYRRLAHRAVATVPKGWHTVIHFDPPDAVAAMRAWLGDHLAYIPQGDGDLGERLKQALALANPEGKRRVFLLGADCPALTPSALERAAERLLLHDAVVGPALDGGYYTLGVRTGRTPLLDRIDWGTERVLAQTRARAAEAGLSLHELEPLEDVDDLASWQRAQQWLTPAGP